MLLSLLAPLLVSQAFADSVPARAVPVPRIAEAEVAVDGRLDEPVWRQAAVLRGFSQYLPTDNRSSDDSTTVLVWYSPTAIYFGIRAWQDSAGVRATLADRDRIFGDDYVEILLDTFNDQRRAFLFAANPLGVQADGTLQDAAQAAVNMMSASGGGAYAVDLSPDFVYESRGRLTADGYDVEIRIPFKSLRYQSRDPQDWGVNVIRRVQATGHEHTWTRVLQTNASFLAQSGTLTGLTDLRRGLVLDINPEMTSAVTGADAPAGWDYFGVRPEVGGNVRWGITNNLTLNGTANPDFSQVEADVAQIQYDPREALYFPEKRPFFLDGVEYFRTPVQLIYTRRLVEPVAAAKLTGKVGRTSLALLSGVDSHLGSRTGDDHPVYNLLRLRRDIGGQSTLGIAYTDRVEGDRFNRVGAVDGRLVFGGAYALVFQAGGSATRTTGSTTWAPFWYLNLNRAGRSFGLTAVFRGLDEDFRASSGYLSRVGIVYAALQPTYTHHGARGSFLESWSANVNLDGRWDYGRFWDGVIPNDPRLHLNTGFTLRGGWEVGASLLVESFKYPSELYADYALMGCAVLHGPLPADTVPVACARSFTGTDRLNNLDLALNLSTPRFQNFSADANLVVGRDENFYEWAPATIVIGSLDLTWRPSEQLRVNVLYNHQQYIRPGDGSTVGLRRVPRLKVEYQLTRSIFLRFVGQYDAQRTDALRDDSRTGAPILLCTARAPATGGGACATYTYALGTATNALRVDWLFSYRPTPGTVVFAGYGSGLEEPDAFRFRGLRRVGDGFFVKLSYLFRV
jgi:hypothetical protein